MKSSYASKLRICICLPRHRVIGRKEHKMYLFLPLWKYSYTCDSVKLQLIGQVVSVKHCIMRQSVTSFNLFPKISDLILVSRSKNYMVRSSVAFIYQTRKVIAGLGGLSSGASSHTLCYIMLEMILCMKDLDIVIASIIPSHLWDQLHMWRIR